MHAVLLAEKIVRASLASPLNYSRDLVSKITSRMTHNKKRTLATEVDGPVGAQVGFWDRDLAGTLVDSGLAERSKRLLAMRSCLTYGDYAGYESWIDGLRCFLPRFEDMITTNNMKNNHNLNK